MSSAAKRLVTGIGCPFLRAAGPESLQPSMLPTLVKTVGSQCPYLQRASKCKRSEACPMLQRSNTDALIQSKIDALKSEGRYRKFWDINRKVGQFPEAKLLEENNLELGKDVTVWCNNDYLGMGQHSKVLNAMHEALDKVGAGAGGTRNISGTSRYHTDLERSLARLHAHQSALVFSSGYVANEAALNALGSLPNCHFFSDALNHASMICGIRNSRARKDVFRHNDVAHLKELLSKADPDAPKIVVFESVYSMDGDIAPIEEICDIADQYGALTFIDEVHAVGLYGKHGAGVAERDDIQHRLSMVSGTLGKAFGCFGGYVTGTTALMDYIRSYAPGFIFTTALPPAVAAGALASVDLLSSPHGQELRRRHQERAYMLKQVLKEVGLPVMSSESHIVPLLIADPRLCKLASDMLLSKHNIYVQPINYPTVPRGTERLRFTPSPLHNDTKMHELRDALLSVWDELNITAVAA